MVYLYKHPNFKALVKNRKYPEWKGGCHPCEFFTLCPDGTELGDYSGTNNGKFLFLDAARLNGRVFLKTYAGSIEIFENDFP